MKKKEILASVDELIEEELIGKEDTWSGYHGRQKQIRPNKKHYFKIHKEVFDYIIIIGGKMRKLLLIPLL